MNMEEWIKELCPEIADWQVELIVEHCQAKRERVRPTDEEHKAILYGLNAKGMIQDSKPWVPLTDDQIKEIVGPYGGPIKGYTRALFDKIDAKLRENNT